MAQPTVGRWRQRCIDTGVDGLLVCQLQLIEIADVGLDQSLVTIKDLAVLVLKGRRARLIVERFGSLICSIANAERLGPRKLLRLGHAGREDLDGDFAAACAAFVIGISGSTVTLDVHVCTSRAVSCDPTSVVAERVVFEHHYLID